MPAARCSSGCAISNLCTLGKFCNFAYSILQWKASRGSDEVKYTYPEISVHAISRDFDIFPHECLYILVIQDELPGAVWCIGVVYGGAE